MSLRFAIFRQIDKLGNEKVMVEYDEGELKKRLCANVFNKLAKTKKPFRGFTKETIELVVSESFDDLVKEFKSESIRIK